MAVLVFDERRLPVNRYDAAQARRFSRVFMPNDVKPLGNNNAKAIPVPGDVFGITIRKDGHIQEDRIAL
jgi:hypothetical protein